MLPSSRGSCKQTHYIYVTGTKSIFGLIGHKNKHSKGFKLVHLGEINERVKPFVCHTCVINVGGCKSFMFMLVNTSLTN